MSAARSTHSYVYPEYTSGTGDVHRVKYRGGIIDKTFETEGDAVDYLELLERGVFKPKFVEGSMPEEPTGIFTLALDCSNDTFAQNGLAVEIRRILVDQSEAIAAALIGGIFTSNIRDENGNRIGRWTYTP